MSTDIERLAATLQPHARAPRERAAPLGRARPASPGGGAQARRARPPRRGQPVADGAAAAHRGRRPRTRRRSCGRSSRRRSALANQAMGELLDLARQLRPTALDDHGLVAALHDPRARPRPPRAGARELLGGPAPRATCRPTPRWSSTASRRRRSSTPPATPGATRVEVNLEPRDSRVRLEVADNGAGFAFAEEGKGLGLSGMRERALLVGGTLEIDSRPGKGTTVVLEVPAERPPRRRERAARADRTSRHRGGMKILIADDHGIVRSGVKLLLDRQPDMEVVAEAEDGVDALEQAVRLKPGHRGARRLDAAHDGPAGDARDQEAVARHAGADPVHARRRALPVRGAARGRVRLRAEARRRQGPASTPSGPRAAASRS